MGLEPHQKGSAPKKSIDISEQLNEWTQKFQRAFEQFHLAKDKESKKHLFSLMDENLKKMDESAKVVTKKGVRKQESLLSKDAKIYFENQNDENYRKLQQDIATLLDANKEELK